MQYLKMRWLYIICFLVLLVSSLFAIGVGKVNLISLDRDLLSTILFQIRVPRVLVAIVVGASLSISGLILQGLLQNPLADAYTLGIASGGAFGACLGILINIHFNIKMPIQLLAIVFSFVEIVLVLWLASIKGELETSDVASMVFWLMGSLSSKPLSKVIVITVVFIIVYGISRSLMEELNLMTLGKKEAMSMGVEYDQTYRKLMFLAVTLSAFSVSLCGIIGFVGLVVPHISRMLLGADNQKLLPLSALLGAQFLLMADTLTRTVLMHELPVGVLTTMVGGPFFIYIFITRRR